MFKLVIGNKNYSSWSLRPWLLLKQADIPFEEILIPLYQGDYKQQILHLSPSGKVPCLIDANVAVWDSLAIAEYLAELYPSLHLWPDDPATRAEARSISAEMHAGFGSLRSEMGMNLRRHLPDTVPSAGTRADIERIETIWHHCRQRHGAAGPFLFGKFSIADAMYAPVCTRFRTYGVQLAPENQAYCDHMLALPAMREWYAAAEAEQHVIPQFEPAGVQP